MNIHDAWTSLRHGGNLLSTNALMSLPQPFDCDGSTSDRLRAVVTGFDSGRPTGDVLSKMLDVVLQAGCGLVDGWRKGNQVGPADVESLLDGTTLKPRRILSISGVDVLAVFATDSSRIGLGAGRRPVAHAIEYMRRRRLDLSLLTNGSQWRLIWADQDSFAWVEWDSARWLDGDRVSSAFQILRLVLSYESLTPDASGLSPLLSAIRDTRRGQAALSSELGERVRRAVERLLVSRRPVIGPAWDEHNSSSLYVAACHFIMRMVVIEFAEAREMLPVDNPVYHQAYGLRGLLEQLDRMSPERRRSRYSAWPRLLGLFRLLYDGSPHPSIVLPRYGGDLFRPGTDSGDGVQRAISLIESSLEPPDDESIHQILVLLTRTTQRIRDGAAWRMVAAPVDFTELTSEYIGILYEGLLDYELRRVDSEPIVFLNLGDQPALPLDRLESMDDKTLAELVKKAKVKRTVKVGDDDGDDEADDEDETDSQEEDEEDGEPSDDLPVVESTDQSEQTLSKKWEAARIRSVAWGRRAVLVGKLVKGIRKNSKAKNPDQEKAIDAAARNLIADVKLPGELYLVRWGGTRKGAGTFYTRPQLTMPTVRRTLEPLMRDDDGTVLSPEELLSLKVCDPAMGSGSFLVAALRVLTAAVIESLHVHGRIKPVNGTTYVDCELIPQGDRDIATDGFQDRLEVVTRRAVVENCLYGVDIDPLAVELARVAMWVETLDRRLPFTFLDHKLRCGNSLIGTWLDRFRDYPLLCFDRESPDKKHNGVHFETGIWQKKLTEVRSAAAGEQADILSGQIRIGAQPVSDDHVRSALDMVRSLYSELRLIPSGRPDERARIWRERIMPDAALHRIRQSFDTWCSLWFWPLDKLDIVPMPGTLHSSSQEAVEVVRTVSERMRFFHWELEFPDVFVAPESGFDAIVGNPPWETQKPVSKEFFSNHDPLYRTYGKQDALRKQRELFQQKPGIESQWLDYVGDFKARGNFVRYAAQPFGDGNADGHDGGSISLAKKNPNRSNSLHGDWRKLRAAHTGMADPHHPFRLQGSADLNTYKMFAELGLVLIQKAGRLGMVVPSSLYTDQGTTALRKELLERCDWAWVYSFENRRKVFDIDSRFKFCVFIASKGGCTQVIRAAFMRHDLEDWSVAEGTIDYPRERILAFSPKTLSLLEIRTERDLQVLTKIYSNSVLLGDDGPDGWGIKYATEFHMTNDSKLFIPRDRAEAEGYKPDIYGRWGNESGDTLLPLYEGRMIGQFDFSEKGWVSGKGRGAVWREIPWEDKKIEPQFLIKLEEAVGTKMHLGPKVAYMRVGSSTNSRSVVSTYLRDVPAGDSVFYFLPLDASVGTALSVVGNFGAMAYDFTVRARLGGLNLSEFLMVETPLVKSISTAVKLIVLKLVSARGESRASEWLEYKRLLGKWPWKKLWAATPYERTRLRAILDAIFFHLYTLTRPDVAWIVRDCDHSESKLGEKNFCRALDPKGFWRVDRCEKPELRESALSVVAYDALSECISTCGGDVDAGIEAFCNLNDGEGWMLPETLCIADLGMTRTVDVGVYDEAARTPQPVRSVMGPRFYDWQLAQTPEESWAECEMHARKLMEGMPTTPSVNVAGKKKDEGKAVEWDLFNQGD